MRHTLSLMVLFCSVCAFAQTEADSIRSYSLGEVVVLRGPGSVLYGSNAMGGVINVITKDAKQDGVHTTLKSQSTKTNSKKAQSGCSNPNGVQSEWS